MTGVEHAGRLFPEELVQKKPWGGVHELARGNGVCQEAESIPGIFAARGIAGASGGATHLRHLLQQKASGHLPIAGKPQPRR